MKQEELIDKKKNKRSTKSQTLRIVEIRIRIFEKANIINLFISDYHTVTKA